MPMFIYLLSNANGMCLPFQRPFSVICTDKRSTVTVQLRRCTNIFCGNTPGLPISGSTLGHRHEESQLHRGSNLSDFTNYYYLEKQTTGHHGSFNNIKITEKH